MKVINFLCCAVLTGSIVTAHAQDVQDSRVVGVVAFSSGRTQDSLAAKDVNLTTARVLVQTQRFTILDVVNWKSAQEEIERQKGSEFIERDIIQKGKTLGAKVLVVGYVKNAEIYKQDQQFSARVDYDVKFIDVESGKSVASNSFSGNSEGLANAGSKAGQALQKLGHDTWLLNRKGATSLYLTGSVFSTMSATDKNQIMGKLIDAIESTSHKLNAWVRGAFNINLLCLDVSDQDQRRGFQHVLAEGGNNIGMNKGDALSLVSINQIESAHGKIQDEVRVADLEVEEVRNNTTLCKVTNGGKAISGDKTQVEKYRIVFKQDK